MRLRKGVEPPAASGWDVRIAPATRAFKNYVDYSYEAREIDGKLAVRLTYNGKDKMTFGVLAITDPDFEDRATTMKAQAQDRAAALNAVGASG